MKMPIYSTPMHCSITFLLKFANQLISVVQHNYIISQHMPLSANQATIGIKTYQTNDNQLLKLIYNGATNINPASFLAQNRNNWLQTSTHIYLAMTKAIQKE